MDITSHQNPLIKRIRSLKARRGREREGVFWVEGIRAVREAMDTDWPLEAVVWSPELLTSESARDVLEGSGHRTVSVSRSVFERLSDRDGPQGLGAVAESRTVDLERLRPGTGGPLIALENPQDPGNVGSILRTAAAVGSGAVVLIGASADPFDPQAVRAGMGAVFSVPVARAASAAFLAWAKSAGVGLVGASARAERDYRTLDWPRPLALVFGNEQKGLTAELADALDTAVRIPMQGRVGSLNLATAVAVLVFATCDARGGA